MKRAQRGIIPLRGSGSTQKTIRAKKTIAGFTIIETLMFLAISGAMLMIAFFGTRNTQDRVAFRESLNATEAKIREVFNNVDNGYFGNAGEWSCTNVAEKPVVTLSATDSGGSNSECIFLGKEITFNNDKMVIDTILALRADPTKIAEPSVLRDEYKFNSTVAYVGSPGLAVKATRSDDATEIRANRYKDGDPITDISPATLCFILGDKKGTITIKERDIEVQYYKGSICP